MKILLFWALFCFTDGKKCTGRYNAGDSCGAVCNYETGKWEKLVCMEGSGGEEPYALKELEDYLGEKNQLIVTKIWKYKLVLFLNNTL